MINGVGIITYRNNYETIDYFSHRLAEAFIRRDVNVIFTTVPVLSSSLGPAKACFQHSLINFTCSFGLAAPLDEMTKIWKQAPLPHLHILIDPLAYAVHQIKHPNILVSSIDEIDCENAHRQGVENILFLPHGIEKDLQPLPGQKRPYDVSMLATCYDPESQKILWRRNYPQEITRIIESGIETALADPSLSYWKVIDMVREQYPIDPGKFQWDLIYASIDYYIRALDRIALVRSIQDAEVHVFGGSVLHYQKNIKGWGHYLSDQPNVIIHPSLPFSEALEMMKQSKICLNSAPMYKKGSHERIFASLACGAVPITSDNPYVRSQFVPGEDLYVYTPGKMELVNGIVNELLADESKRRAVAARGRSKVMAAHTWDHRVDALLQALPPLLEKIVYEQRGSA